MKIEDYFKKPVVRTEGTKEQEKELMKFIKEKDFRSSRAPVNPDRQK